MKELTPKEMREFIVDCLMCSPPEIPHVAGKPGIGKSDLYESVADEFGLLLVTQHLSQKLPEDLTGLPRYNPETGKAEYTPFDVFPMAGDPIPDGYNGWLVFLDELSDAPDEIWSAIYPLLLGHTVGGQKLHPKALICTAGNRATDSALSRELPDTIITRVLVATMKAHTPDWLDWARNAKDSNERVIEFIAKYPNMLLGSMKTEDRQELEAYNTPRGWAKAMSIVNLHEKRIAKVAEQTGKSVDGAPLTDSAKRMIASAVGDMAQRQFVEFYNDTLRIPFPFEIAAAPSSEIVPPTTLGKAQVTSSLATYYVDNIAKRDSTKNILVYVNRLPKENGGTFLQMVKEKLGQTASSKEKVKEIETVLGINLLS